MAAATESSEAQRKGRKPFIDVFEKTPALRYPNSIMNNAVRQEPLRLAEIGLELAEVGVADESVVVDVEHRGVGTHPAVRFPIGRLELAEVDVADQAVPVDVALALEE